MPVGARLGKIAFGPFQLAGRAGCDASPAWVPFPYWQVVKPGGAAEGTGMAGPHPPLPMQDVPAPPQPAVTVWYDGTCPLCLREIALMRRLDRGGRIGFIDLTPPDAACPVDRQLMLERFHARENGVLLSGAAAFAAMWRAIPALRPLGLAARQPAVLWLLERTYRAFLKIRPLLQELLR